MKLGHSLTPYIKINSKWIKEKYKTRYYKTLRGKAERRPFDINHSNIFFDPYPIVMEIKTKINK